MPNYPGKRPGRRRVVIQIDGKGREWVIKGGKKEADQFEAHKRLELESSSRATTRLAPTFAEFSTDAYAPHARRHLRDSTWSKVRVFQLATLVEFFGPLKLTHITTQHVEDFKAWRLTVPHGKWVRLAGPASINNELRVLGTVLKYARSIPYPCAQPTIKKLPVRGDGRVKVWTDEELQRIFTVTLEIAPDLLSMLVFLVNTGCRKGEAIAAEWSWIDEKRDLLSIPVNDVWRPKSNRPREVPLSTAVRAILAGPRNHERFIFTTTGRQSPKAQRASFPQQTWVKIRKAAKVVGGVHCFRHTFASHFLRKLPDMFLLAQILGHSHSRVTELYSHLLPGHLERAKDAVSLFPETLAATLAAYQGNAKNPEELH